jgi:BatD DUF11 like domain
MLRYLTYTLLLFLFAIQASAQTKLTALPSKTVVHPGETFQLQYVAEDAIKADEFVAPSFRNFEQVGDMVHSNGWTWVNGSLTEYISYTFLLRPKMKGKLSIASAVMKVKGRILVSPIVTIHVTDAAPVNTDVTASREEEKPDYYLAPNEDAKEKIKKNLFVKATIDKQSCYVGEALLATFKLYTKLDSESKIIKRPSFNGFSVIDLEEPEAGIFTKEMVNGKLYNCYLIRKVQLFPLQSGEVIIEPIQILNKVRLLRAAARDGKDWMDALSNKEKERELTSETVIEEELITETPALHIKVMDLPQKDKPESFTGAVGNFAIKTQLISNEFAADESGVLKVEVSGSGNLTMVNAPAVSWPAGVEVFEPRVQEEINKMVSPINGIKIFDIPFTAVKGAYKIPPVVFSFFDVASKTYQTISTDSVFFTVKEALQKKRKILQTQQQTTVKAPPGINQYFLIGGVAFVLLLALTVFFVKRKKKPAGVPVAIVEDPKPLTSTFTFIAPAQEVKDSLHHKQFYSLLLDGLQEFFIDRLQLQHQKVNNMGLVDVLKQKNMLQEASLWNSIVNRCEEALFSPIDLRINKDELLTDAEALMNGVDRKV